MPSTQEAWWVSRKLTMVTLGLMGIRLPSPLLPIKAKVLRHLETSIFSALLSFSDELLKAIPFISMTFCHSVLSFHSYVCHFLSIQSPLNITEECSRHWRNKTTHNPLGIPDESAWTYKDVVLQQRIQVCATTRFVIAHIIMIAKKGAIKQDTFKKKVKSKPQISVCLVFHKSVLCQTENSYPSLHR